MSFQFMDSMQGYTSIVQAAMKYDATSLSSYQAAAGRFGGPSIRLTTTPNFLTKIITADQTIILNFCMALTSVTANANVLLTLSDATVNHVDFRTDTSGHLYATRNGTTLGTSTLTLTSNVQHYYEIKVKIDDTTGTVEVKVDGTTFLNLSGLDTRNAGTATVDRFRFGLTVSTVTMDISQLYVQNGAGGADNDFIGDLRIAGVVTSGVGNSAQFTPSAGSNFQTVDESNPNDDTDYNESNTVDHIDTFAFTNFAIGGTVKALQITTYAKKTDAGARQIADVMRIGGTDYVGTTKTLASSYQMHIEGRVVSPATAVAFTEAEVNGAEFGYKLIA